MIGEFIKAKREPKLPGKGKHSAAAYTWRAKLGIKNPANHARGWRPKDESNERHFEKEVARGYRDDAANAKKSLFGMAKFEKAYVEGQKGRFATVPEGAPGHISRVGNMTSKNAASIKTGTYRLRNLGRTSPSSVNRLAKLSGLEKAVVAGTRPFAKRPLSNQDVKQVRAKAPRYGMTKGVGSYIDQSKEDSGETKIKVKVKIKIKKSLCDNCGRLPVSGGVPLCKACAHTMEKGRKKKPSMVDHIMRMESGDADDDESRHAMQQMVNSGTAWKMQGSYGRAAMDMINAGHIALGHTGHRDYYGSYVPSRHEVQEGTKGHASFVRAAGYEPDKCGADCPSPEVPDQLPKAIRNKKVNKAFADFPLGPLSKTYVRVAAARAERFLKSDSGMERRYDKDWDRKKGSSVKDGFGLEAAKTKGANTVEECGDCGFAGTGKHKCPMPNAVKKSGYPSAQCKKCGFHGNALQVMTHMQTVHPIATRVLANQSRQPSIRKSMEFMLLDENHPDYHGHTGGGAGYAGKKWVHMHGPTTSSYDPDPIGLDHGTDAVDPKSNHRHFKMGAFTTHHSPDGYQSELLARHHTDNQADSTCALPNCGHRESRHSFGDDGRPACMDCNNVRPRRNVRHSFRSTPDPRP